MYFQKVLMVVFAVFYIMLSCTTHAHREQKRKLEISHTGKSLEELVSLGAHVDPHDIKGLAESVEPELMEETHQERLMLQENGIEDPYPLDATIEYEHKKKLPKPIMATENNPKEKSSFSFEDPEDPRYSSNDMPEYAVETKADFKGNQEAADWLMHDPNKFNIMPDEDTKNLFSEGKESDETNYDPIRLDNDDKQDSQYQSFNADDEQAYTKIQESLAPDSNMAKIYTKYENYLNRVDQKLIDKNKNNVEHNVDAAGDDIIDNVNEGSDITITDTNDEHKMKDHSVDVHNSDVTSVNDKNDKVSEDNNSEGRLFRSRGGEENKTKTSKDEDNVFNLENVSKGTLLKILEEKLKVGEEKQDTDKKVHKEASTSAIENESDGSQRENGVHSNKLNDGLNEINTPSSLSSSGVSRGSKLKTQNVVPVYRISHRHKIKVHKESQRHDRMPRVGQPLTEQGTSRQNVDINRESFGTSSFHRPPVSDEYSRIAQMMISRRRDENPYKQDANSLVQGSTKLTKLDLEYNPQEPEDGQGRHGIPNTRFGQWNGWSECTVSCDTGSQIRARICLQLPCQSKDLYQTRKCTRDICPGKWRKESLKAHNRIRALHHTHPLVWSNSLTKKAKQQADSLASRDYISSEDLHEEQGENIAQLRETKNSDSIAQDAVDLWYNEVKSYSFSYPELTMGNKHFVQMVWKQAKSLGMASTPSPNGEYTFVVALYGGPDVDNKYLHDNVFRAGQKHDVYTTFKRSRGPNRQVWRNHNKTY